MAATVWTTGGCVSWYLNAAGRNPTLWPGSTIGFRRATRRLDPAEYDLIPPRRAPDRRGAGGTSPRRRRAQLCQVPVPAQAWRWPRDLADPDMCVHLWPGMGPGAVDAFGDGFAALAGAVLDDSRWMMVDDAVRRPGCRAGGGAGHAQPERQGGAQHGRACCCADERLGDPHTFSFLCQSTRQY